MIYYIMHPKHDPDDLYLYRVEGDKLEINLSYNYHPRNRSGFTPSGFNSLEEAVNHENLVLLFQGDEAGYKRYLMAMELLK